MRFLLILLSLMIIPIGFAEQKHPRALELEDKYKSDIKVYLENRFPNEPFAIEVQVDPLRRQLSEGYDVKGEKLPFYALDEETIVDEWDDPTATLYSLSNRVKSVTLSIQVPQKFSDNETNEIKEAITTLLRLIPARDSIKVVRKPWNVQKVDFMNWGIAGGALLIFLLGILLISRSSARKMAHSMSQIQSSLGSNSGGSSAPSPVSLPQQNLGDSGGPKGDLSLNDPLKIREVIDYKITDLATSNELFRLENMIILDKLGQDSPKTLGALLVNFPMDVQKKIFSFSQGTYWMEAFTSPGEPNLKCLEVVEDLHRASVSTYNPDWENLLIQIWRLGELRSNFLKQMGFDKAMDILKHMPQFVSIPTARAAFPGQWASLLDDREEREILSPEEIQSTYEQALKLVPLIDFSVLGKYKKSQELLSYVQEVNITEEQEVYNASPDDSILHLLRSPFYVLFEQDENFLKEISAAFSIDEWAVALFNVPREKRKLIDGQFSEKMKFLYLEKLRYMDKHRPNIKDVVATKNRVSAFVGDRLREQEAQDNVFNLNSDEPQGDNQDAA